MADPPSTTAHTAADPPPRGITLGVVLFRGWEPLDVMGPVEVFAACDDSVRVTYIAAAIGNVPATRGGVQQPADTTFEDVLAGRAPAPAWLLVPGGYGTRTAVHDDALLGFLRAVCPRAELCMAVCTGSALLAAAGLLDGRRATTNKRAFDWAVSTSQRVEWVRQARWVRDGAFVTSSGVSAGMDMAVRVVRDVFGAHKAADVAAYMEYTPGTDPEHDPFADPAFRPAV